MFKECSFSQSDDDDDNDEDEDKDDIWLMVLKACFCILKLRFIFVSSRCHCRQIKKKMTELPQLCDGSSSTELASMQTAQVSFYSCGL